MKKEQLKKKAQEALKEKYGFGPARREIILLETSDEGDYILFEVNDIEYRIWNGKLERLGVRYQAFLEN